MFVSSATLHALSVSIMNTNLISACSARQHRRRAHVALIARPRTEIPPRRIREYRRRVVSALNPAKPSRHPDGCLRDAFYHRCHRLQKTARRPLWIHDWQSPSRMPGARLPSQGAITAAARSSLQQSSAMHGPCVMRKAWKNAQTCGLASASTDRRRPGRHPVQTARQVNPICAGLPARIGICVSQPISVVPPTRMLGVTWRHRPTPPAASDS